MKIILCNKFYYRRGGDCIYTINLEQLLKQHGHDVAVFAMEYPENLGSEWNTYFPSKIDFKFGLDMIEALRRPFGTSKVKSKFKKLMNDFKPDVVHLNNIHSQLSPIIAELAFAKGIRVIWTIHDLKLICARYDCIRDGQRCELCLESKMNCIKYRCMKGSFLASILGTLESRKWNNRRISKSVDYFIAPSVYMKDSLVRGDYSSKKIMTLSNFIDLSKVTTNIQDRRQSYFCYLGRLSKEKGIITLLKACLRTTNKCIIIGSGPLEDEVKTKYKSKNIIFLGQRDWNEVQTILSKARFSILPSECYENNPLSVIESLCLGTPVLGAKIGGIPELIEENLNGMMFESGNIEDLVNKIDVMFKLSFDYKNISKTAQQTFNGENYYNKLIEIYNR